MLIKSALFQTKCNLNGIHVLQFAWANVWLAFSFNYLHVFSHLPFLANISDKSDSLFIQALFSIPNWLVAYLTGSNCVAVAVPGWGAYRLENTIHYSVLCARVHFTTYLIKNALNVVARCIWLQQWLFWTFAYATALCYLPASNFVVHCKQWRSKNVPSFNAALVACFYFSPLLFLAIEPICLHSAHPQKTMHYH